jgi:invasion protein IalB
MRAVVGSLVLLSVLALPFLARASTSEAYFAEWSPGPNGGEHAIGSWLINCSKDSFSDRNSCAVRAKVSNGYSDLVFLVVDKNVVVVRVGNSRRYPSTPSYARVDDDSAVKWNGDDGLASGFDTGLVARIKSGRRVRTRWYAFPDATVPRDQEVSLVGITAALDRARQVISGSYSFNAEQAVKESKVAGTLMASPMAYIRQCDATFVDVTDQRVRSALARRPDLLAVVLEARAAVMPSIEAIVGGRSSKSIDCDGKKADLNRVVAKFLDKLERFQ